MNSPKFLFGLFVFFLINLIQAVFTPVTEDEAYYWVWSQNPDWGYFDHPPMIAWWIAGGYAIIKNTLGVRLVSVVLNSFALFLLGSTLEMNNQKQRQVFWLIIGSVIILNVYGFLATPDAPLLFFTLLYLFSLKKFLEKDTLLMSVLLGISFAGLMYSKYHAALLIAFTLLPLTLYLWKKPRFYLAAAIGLSLYLPHLNWLAEHDFISFRYHFLERSADETFELRKLNNYLLICIFGCAPLLSWFVWKSILKFKSRSLFDKSLWWLAVLPMVFFFFSIFKDNVQPQWLLISFVAMAMLTWKFYSEITLPKSFLILGFSGVVLVLLLRMALVIPSVSPLEKYERFGLNTQKLSVENAVFEKYQEASLYMYFNPGKKAAVHRTLGNRKSQFTLWESEDDFSGRKITYISPWIKGDSLFLGFKDRVYSSKNIPDFISTDYLTATILPAVDSFRGDSVRIPVELQNKGPNVMKIGGDSPLQLNVSFYKNRHHEVLFQKTLQIEPILLKTGEKVTLEAKFLNTAEPGQYKAAIGIHYLPMGTTYISPPFSVTVE